MDDFVYEGHTSTADGIVEDQYGIYIFSYQGSSADVRPPVEQYWELSDMDETVNTILERAFAGKRVERVVLHERLNYIGDEAFAGCTSLREIAILCPWAKISGTAFAGCSEELIIYGYRGSEAEAAAEALGCYFEPIDE